MISPPAHREEEEVSLTAEPPAGRGLPPQRTGAMPAQRALPANLPLAIMLVATSLMVLWEGPDEVTVVTRQAFSESQ